MTEQKLIETTNTRRNLPFTMRRFIWVLGLTLTFGASLLALGMSLYTYHIQTQQQQLINQQLDNTSMLSSTLEEVIKNKPFTNNPQQLSKVEEDIRSLHQSITELRSQLKAVDDRLTSSAINKPISTELTLLEVKNLLQLADLHLRYAKNSPAATQILTAAAELITPLTNPLFLVFRQKLQNKITELKAVPHNKEPVLLKVKQLARELSQLELSMVGASHQEETTHSQLPTDTHSPMWRHAWQLTLKKLEKIIVVKEINPQKPPLFFPEHQKLLRENLQLLIQQMQWAVLIGDNNLLQKCVGDIRLTMENALFSNKNLVTQALSSLTAISRENLSPALPDLQELIADFHSLLSRIPATLLLSYGVLPTAGDKK